MKHEDVSHKGKVVRITPQVTTVSIQQSGACAACHAAGLCGMSEVTEKAVEVPTDPYARYKEGDEVEVLLKASMGMKAVWLAYGIPILVLLAFILGLGALGVGEVAAALGGIGVVALYDLVLWLLRGRLQNEYVFTIKR